MPALTKKSTSTDFNFVWPDLKSSPAIKTPCVSANSMTPGTNVFCGEPLIYVQFSAMLAMAKMVDGEISEWFASNEASNSAAVSLSPFSTHANRSVFAVHKTMTLSTLLVALKSRISRRICSYCSYLVPDIRFFARDNCLKLNFY